jgi:aldose 1-epimerase
MQGYIDQLAPDGHPVQLIVLSNSTGMQVQFMDWGATWLSCLVPLTVTNEAKFVPREVLLRSPTFAEHLIQDAYFGATVGRYANRIRHATFALTTPEGIQSIQLTPNDSGNSLHGGPRGFDSQRWHVDSFSATKVAFSLISMDGDQGFPGHLQARASYELTPDNTVVASFEASTDKPCPVNLANHAYFNLDPNHDSVLLHQLQIQADHFLPVLESGIPDGGLRSVVGTSFDFLAGKPIGQDLLADAEQRRVAGYDHGFLLNTDAAKGEAPAAKLTATDGRLQLVVTTTKPALQVYTGNYLAGTLGAAGQPYAAHAGVALESEFLPDAPNHPEWPHTSSILLPEQRYAYRTAFRFASTGTSFGT